MLLLEWLSCLRDRKSDDNTRKKKLSRGGHYTINKGPVTILLLRGFFVGLSAIVFTIIRDVMPVLLTKVNS